MRQQGPVGEVQVQAHVSAVAIDAVQEATPGSPGWRADPAPDRLQAVHGHQSKDSSVDLVIDAKVVGADADRMSARK